MLTSNVQLGYVLTRGGEGKLSRVVYLVLRPEFHRMDNPQILLHHLLQEYLVERDINFTEMLISNVQLGCLLTKGWGASCPGWFILPPPLPAQNFSEN